MENLNAITAFFRNVWEVFSIEHPLLGIPFSVIYLGAFAVAFSIVILRPILGIGSGVVDNISASGRSAVRSARSRNRSRKAASYEAYKAGRKREESYARRYERGE